jgi:hypothetical protein
MCNHKRVSEKPLQPILTCFQRPLEIYEEICGKIVNASGFLKPVLWVLALLETVKCPPLQLSESFRPTRIELENTSSFQVN